MKERLLKRLPKKYHERIHDFYQESDLIDDCKYMLSFNSGWELCDMDTLPCKTIKEAIQYIKEANFQTN